MTTKEIYDRTIKPLPAAQRLELATLILGDVPPQALVDYRTEWSDEDMEDLNRASWMADIAAEWHEELADPREDIYSLNDGVPVARFR